MYLSLGNNWNNIQNKALSYTNRLLSGNEPNEQVVTLNTKFLYSFILGQLTPSNSSSLDSIEGLLVVNESLEFLRVTPEFFHSKIVALKKKKNKKRKRV